MTQEDKEPIDNILYAVACGIKNMKIMTQKDKAIEIPFGAKDSELLEWVYFIPEGMEAEIKDRKVIIKKAESEDERIRKELINYILYKADGVSEEQEHSWIAYLEKQKEQKPAEWSEEDINDVIERLELAYKETKNEMFLEDIMRLKSLRFQQKDDFDTLQVDFRSHNEAFEAGREFERNRKSSWKPSEGQMKALEDAFRKDGSDEYRKTINSLYQDLKKLM